MASLPVKYRPQTFDEVDGQELVCTALKNQVAQQQFRPMYLFAGSAGIGKTTVARIFAHAITGTPQGVVEIDAASNSGVDAVLALREDAYYHPMTGTRKVYIIDECHVLTAAAIAALLTLLENPPPYATFILCTTDPGKLPLTILSRAQRYNFQRMSLETLERRMQEVAIYEGRTVTPRCVQALARRARGCMRDALSMLDAVFAYLPDGTIDWADVAPLLELAEEPLYWALVEACAEHRADTLARVLQDVHRSGRDWSVFFAGWVEHILRLREVQLLGVAAQADWMIEAEDVGRRVQALSGDTLLAWIDKSLDTLGKLRYDPIPWLRIQAFFLLLGG